MIKRSLICALSMIVVLICLLSMVCPSQTLARLIPEGEATVYPISSLSGTNATISENGEVTITGGNPNIYLNNIDMDITTIAINFREPLSASVEALIYYDTGNGLSEGEKAYAYAFEGDEWICFVIPSSHIKAARLDINLDYKINSVNLYNEPPQVHVEKQTHSIWKYIICVLTSVGVFCLIFFLDKKKNFINSAFDCIKAKRKSIAIGFGALILSVALAVAAEFIMGLIFGVSSTGSAFNIYRCIFAFGVIASVTALILLAKSVAEKPEKLVLCLLLIIGTVMIFAAPFGHISWDVDSHYLFALDTSYFGPAYATEADNIVLHNQDLYMSKESALENVSNIKTLNDAHNHVISSYQYERMISHLPSGIFIALARFFNANFYWVYTLGKVPNLLIYAFCFYFAIKKLKSGKMIFAVFAFFPTNLLLATQYSYDYWVTAFSVLGIAYFVSHMQQPDTQISLKDSVTMCGSLALACIPKQLYAPMLLIPFLLRKNDFKKRKRYYTVCALAFAVLFLWLAVRSFTTVSSTGDLRGGSTVSPTGQIKFILGDPFNFIKILLEFLAKYLSFGAARDYISNLAYIGYGYGHIILLALFIIAAFTDKNEYDLNNKYLIVKGFNLLLLVGMAALMAAAFYIDFTPVGSDYISGCQGRYLTPLLLPVMSVIGSKMLNNKLNRTLYNYLFIIPCCAVVLYTVATSFISRLA